MGRPRTGSKTVRPNGRIEAGVPNLPGRKPSRITETFDTDRQASRWIAASLVALEAGEEPPDPAPFRAAARAMTPTEVPLEHRTIERALRGWWQQHYELQRLAQPERGSAVKSMIDLHIIPFFRSIDIERMTDLQADHVVAFASHLAAQDFDADEVVSFGEELVTVTELIRHSTKSRSTVRRALNDQVQPVDFDDEGEALYRVGDAAAAGLMTVAVQRGGLSKGYANNILWVIKKTIAWTLARGWISRDVSDGIRSVVPNKLVAVGPDTKIKQPLTLEQCAEVARGLTVIHQAAMWLQRLLGLRIGEAFGPLVGDLIDEGTYGRLVVDKQGGRSFLVRNERGAIEVRDHKERLKNDDSVRCLLVPRHLMVLLRHLIQAYHTDPSTGRVDLDARLVPGIREANRSGAHNYRSSLGHLLKAGGIDRFQPHDLRKSLATDLRYSGITNELIQKRYLGHVGEDVHDRVYVLDVENAKPQLAIAAHLDELIETQLAGNLMVPTVKRHQFGTKNPIRHRLSYVDEVLSACGWQVGVSDACEPLLDTKGVAEQLGIAPTTARRLIREGHLPAARTSPTGGHLVRSSDVDAWNGTGDTPDVSLADAARALNVTYHEAWRMVDQLELVVERDGSGRLVLTDDVLSELEQEAERVRQLHLRAVKHVEAARRLGCSRRSVSDKIARGDLDLDDESDSSGAQFVTLLSVERYLNSRVGSAGMFLTLEHAAELTGMTPTELVDLLRAGHVAQKPGRGRIRLCTSSLGKWAESHRPELQTKIRTAAGS
jgi:excisionase family DNA binding protein